MTKGMTIMRTQRDSFRRSGPASATGWEASHAALERALIDEFLRRIGHTPCSLQWLPMNQQTTLLRAASTFATLKLAEIESRARLGDDISGA